MATHNIGGETMKFLLLPDAGFMKEVYTSGSKPRWTDEVTIPPSPDVKIRESIVNKLADSIAQFTHEIATAINNHSAEIVTSAIVICAFGMMLGPLVGSKTGKWFGMVVGSLWIGIVWRLAT